MMVPVPRIELSAEHYHCSVLPLYYTCLLYTSDGSKIKVSNDATIEGTRLSDTAFTSFFEFLSYNIRNLDTTSFLHIENKNRIYEINVNQICYIENVTEKPDDYL